ncbi:uncharacterized protein [Procambarus clarkii]
MRPYRLWIPQDSYFTQVNDWRMKNFPSNYRSQVLLWEANENLLTGRTVRSMWRLHQQIVNLTLNVGDSVVTWDHVCTRVPSLITDTSHHRTIRDAPFEPLPAENHKGKEDYEAQKGSILASIRDAKQVFGNISQAPRNANQTTRDTGQRTRGTSHDTRKINPTSVDTSQTPEATSPTTWNSSKASEDTNQAIMNFSKSQQDSNPAPRYNLQTLKDTSPAPGDNPTNPTQWNSSSAPENSNQTTETTTQVLGNTSPAREDSSQVTGDTSHAPGDASHTPEDTNQVQGKGSNEWPLKQASQKERELMSRVPREVWETAKTDYSHMLPRDMYCSMLNSLPSLCYERGVLEVWGYHQHLLMNLTNEEVLHDVNEMTTSHVFGYPLQVTDFLGGVERDDSGHIVAARSALHTWVTMVNTNSTSSEVDLGTGQLVDQESMAWEVALLHQAQQAHIPSDVTLYVHAAHSFGKLEFVYRRLDERWQQQEAMAEVRQMVESCNVSGYHAAWAHVYSQWETDASLASELWRNLGLVISVVAVVAMVVVGAGLVALLVVGCVVATLVEVAALMHLSGLTVDTVTTIALVLAVGLCVDYAAHIAHAFLEGKGSRQARAQAAVSTVGPAVLHAGLSTLLAFLALAPSQSHLFFAFFKIFTSMSVLGLFQGLVVLPALLSLVGSDPRNLQHSEPKPTSAPLAPQQYTHTHHTPTPTHFPLLPQP